MYHHEYGDVAIVPGADLALVTAVRGDNSGPHTPRRSHRFMRISPCGFPMPRSWRQTSPIWRMRLCPIAPTSGGETGNWRHVDLRRRQRSAQSARYRALSRLRDEWIANSKFKTGDETISICYDTCCLRPSTHGEPIPRPGSILEITFPPTWPKCSTQQTTRSSSSVGLRSAKTCSTASPRFPTNCALKPVMRLRASSL